MIERVVIGKSATDSPLRVAAVGYDANNAEFDELLFDGNQPPLRLHHIGYVYVDDLDYANLAPAWTASVAYPPLNGYPQFCVMSRKTNSTNNGQSTLKPQPACRGGGSGGGGVVTPNKFWGVNWDRKYPFPSGPSYRYVNFAIFKNYLP